MSKSLIFSKKIFHLFSSKVLIFYRPVSANLPVKPDLNPKFLFLFYTSGFRDALIMAFKIFNGSIPSSLMAIIFVLRKGGFIQ